MPGNVQTNRLRYHDWEYYGGKEGAQEWLIERARMYYLLIDEEFEVSDVFNSKLFAGLEKANLLQKLRASFKGTQDNNWTGAAWGQALDNANTNNRQSDVTFMNNYLKTKGVTKPKKKSTKVAGAAAAPKGGVPTVRKKAKLSTTSDGENDSSELSEYYTDNEAPSPTTASSTGTAATPPPAAANVAAPKSPIKAAPTTAAPAAASSGLTRLPWKTEYVGSMLYAMTGGLGGDDTSLDRDFQLDVGSRPRGYKWPKLTVLQIKQIYIRACSKATGGKGTDEEIRGWAKLILKATGYKATEAEISNVSAWVLQDVARHQSTMGDKIKTVAKLHPKEPIEEMTTSMAKLSTSPPPPPSPSPLKRTRSKVKKAARAADKTAPESAAEEPHKTKKAKVKKAKGNSATVPS